MRLIIKTIKQVLLAIHTVLSSETDEQSELEALANYRLQHPEEYKLK